MAKGDTEPTADRRNQAELKQLREAKEDLEDQVRDLEAQLAAACEIRRRVSESDSRAEADMGGWSPSLPPASGPTALLKRTARRAIRGTLGVARQVWGAADPALRHVVSVLSAAEPATVLPRLTVLVEGSEIPPDLAHQTLEDLEVALWDREEGTLTVLTLDGHETKRAAVRNGGDVLANLGGDYIMTRPAAARSISSTLLERLQWVVASERPSYVRVVDSTAPELEPDAAFMLWARNIWQPGDAPPLGLLDELAENRPLLGVTIGLADEMEAVVPRLGALGPGSHPVVRRTGRFDVWAGNRRGPVEHLVHPLPNVPAPATAENGRPVVVVVATVPLDAGSDQLLFGVQAALAADVRPVVAITAAAHRLSLRRTAQLEMAGALVYELGSVLEPSVVPSAVARIINRYDPRLVLTIGSDPCLQPVLTEAHHGGVRVVSLDGADGGRPLVPLGWPPLAVPEEVAPRRRLELRAALGVPVDRYLVVAAVDLVPRSRPEDVVLVADRLREEEDIDFLLVGEGPLASHIVDLMGYLDRSRLRLRRPVVPLHELVAVADLVLDPSEGALVRPAVVAAVQMGTPVLVTPGGGVEELVATSDSAGMVVDRAGDPGALAEAVLRIRQLGMMVVNSARASESTRLRFEAGVGALREAVLGERSDVSEG